MTLLLLREEDEMACAFLHQHGRDDLIGKYRLLLREKKAEIILYAYREKVGMPSQRHPNLPSDYTEGVHIGRMWFGEGLDAEGNYVPWGIMPPLSAVAAP